MKVLLIGLGGIGQRHARNLRRMFGTSVTLLAYRVRRNSVALNDRLEVDAGINLEDKLNLQVFDDLDAALAERPAAAFICNPSSLHLEVALKAASAGCHLFIEKPLSSNLEQVDELIRLAAEKKLIAFVAYQMRFHPCLKRVKALLEGAAIGRLVSAKAEVGEHLPSWHPYEDYRTMYASRSDLGGGVILSQIHEMDYIYWLFGLPSRVFAMGGHLSDLEIDVEDTASILMECNGIPIHLYQDYIQRPPSRTLQIIGSAGKILVDFRVPDIRVFGESGDFIESQIFTDFERNQLFLEELSHFFNCIQGTEKSQVTLHDGAQSLRMALAAKESMLSGTVISLA